MCGFATPHFAVAGLCYAKPFYSTAKRQLPVTLDEIKTGLYWIKFNVLQPLWHNIRRMRMKSKSKLFGIVATVVLIGLTIVSCNINWGDRISLSISGTPQVGETITARPSSNWTPSRGDGPVRWYMSAVGGQHDWVSGQNNPFVWTAATSGSIRQYILLRDYAPGRYIRAVRLTTAGYRIYSNVLGPIQP